MACVATNNPVTDLNNCGLAAKIVDSGIKPIFDQISSTATSAASSLSPLGVQIALSLGLILTAWAIIKTLLEGGGLIEIVKDLVFTVLMVNIVTMLITVSPGSTLSYNGLFAPNQSSLLGGITSNVMGKVSQGDLANMNIGSPVDVAGQVIGTAMVTAIVLAWPGVEKENELQTDPQGSKSTVGDIIDTATNMVKGFWETINPVNILLMIVSLAFRIVAAIVVLLAAVIATGQLLMASLYYNVGFALGPIMIPFMLWPVMSFLFDGWLKFMVTTAFKFMVGALIVSFANIGFRQLDQLFASIHSQNPTVTDIMSMSSLPAVFASMACLVLAALIGWMCWEIPSIASALVSGGSGGGLKGNMFKWIGGKATTGGTANKAGEKGGQGAGPGSKNTGIIGASRAAAGMVGGMAGKSINAAGAAVSAARGAVQGYKAGKGTGLQSTSGLAASSAAGARQRLAAFKAGGGVSGAARTAVAGQARAAVAAAELRSSTKKMK